MGGRGVKDKRRRPFLPPASFGRAGRKRERIPKHAKIPTSPERFTAREIRKRDEAPWKFAYGRNPMPQRFRVATSGWALGNGPPHLPPPPTPTHTHANTHTIGREKFRVRTCIMTWGFRKRVVSQGPRVVIWARFLAHSLRRGDVFPKRGFRLKNVQVAMLRMGDYFIWSWRCSAIAPRGDLFRRSIKYSFRLPTDLLESGAKLMRGYSRINDWHCPKEWRNLREAYFREVGTFMDLRRGWDS